VFYHLLGEVVLFYSRSVNICKLGTSDTRRWFNEWVSTIEKHSWCMKAPHPSITIRVESINYRLQLGDGIH